MPPRHKRRAARKTFVAAESPVCRAGGWARVERILPAGSHPPDSRAPGAGWDFATRWMTRRAFGDRPPLVDRRNRKADRRKRIGAPKIRVGFPDRLGAHCANLQGSERHSNQEILRSRKSKTKVR